MTNSKYPYRLIGDLPKIGIRPTIDGRRRGVRESLEDQTMRQAKAAAELISQNLRYTNGAPVECVIADTCIGGVAEAAMCAEKFRKEGVGVTLTVTPCWCYGSETMDMDPMTLKAIWGFNGTERPGAVYLAAVLAAHNQKGLPAFGIYGRDVQDAGDQVIPEDVKEKILRFARAGIAAAMMRGKSYLSIGSVSMGISGSIMDQSFFEKYLGMRVENVDMTEIIRRIDEEIFDPEEYKKAIAWVRKNCIEGEDISNAPEAQLSRAEKDQNWEFVVKSTIIAKDLMVGNPALADKGFGEEALGHNAIAAGFQGQRHWTDHFPNGDFLESILTTSFDWNGIREPFIMATENDNLNGTGMLFNSLVTNTAQIFADVRTYWSAAAVKRVANYELTGVAKDGIIHLINSGAASLDGTGQHTKDEKPVIKPFWDVSELEADACLKATQWFPADRSYFRGGGFSSGYISKGGMPLTMTRMNLVKGLGPVLQIAEGWSVDLPMNVHTILNDRTSPTWPTTWFVPRTTGTGPFRDVYSVMNCWGANHGSISYGHIGADLITLASMLRIPVYMHNVAEENIFRPSAWTSFGTGDLFAADQLACKNFGPLYGKY